MTKDQLLSLWNADNWEVMSCGVYFTAHRADKELHINCNDYTEAEILAMPFWERLAQETEKVALPYGENGQLQRLFAAVESQR